MRQCEGAADELQEMMDLRAWLWIYMWLFSCFHHFKLSYFHNSPDLLEHRGAAVVHKLVEGSLLTRRSSSPQVEESMGLGTSSVKHFEWR